MLDGIRKRPSEHRDGRQYHIREYPLVGHSQTVSDSRRKSWLADMLYMGGYARLPARVEALCDITENEA